MSYEGVLILEEHLPRWNFKWGIPICYQRRRLPATSDQARICESESGEAVYRGEASSQVASQTDASDSGDASERASPTLPSSRELAHFSRQHQHGALQHSPKPEQTSGKTSDYQYLAHGVLDVVLTVVYAARTHLLTGRVSVPRVNHAAIPELIV